MQQTHTKTYRKNKHYKEQQQIHNCRKCKQRTHTKLQKIQNTQIQKGNKCTKARQHKTKAVNTPEIYNKYKSIQNTIEVDN